MRAAAVAVLVIGLITSGACSVQGGEAAGPAATRVDAAERWWHPDSDATWQWQLQGPVNVGYDVDVYDIDLIETPDSTFDRLRDDGRDVVCYFSAGTWETFREGEGPPASALGKPLSDFPDERWLDIRDDGVRAHVIDLLDRAEQRACDGVEPDNVDGYANDSGFDLTGADQLDFNRFVADAAHERGLAVGLKNDLDQVPDLVDHFDFAVNEECHEYDECEALSPFVEAGKPVFNAEYAAAIRAQPDAVCAESRRLGLRTLVLPPDLDDSFRVSCD